MSILRFVKCYSNPFLTLLTAFFFLIYYGDAEIVAGGETNKLAESMGSTYALGAVVFGLLAVWVFSLGALIVLVQLIYGLVKYFTVKEDKSIYLHYFYGFAISLFSYAIIFTAPTT